ncbi:MAG TPA: hypothetical protein VKK31_22570 [Thermoanaerobaculia bacterium]|nr:hypothetical protein [Thermoanaerobaculia bacterium]
MSLLQTHPVAKRHSRLEPKEDPMAEPKGQTRRFLTVKQVTESHPGISERTLRHWIFGAKARRSWEKGKLRMIPGNGFDQVMIRKGAKILIDEIALFVWLEG